jgi:hypothetical protein
MRANLRRLLGATTAGVAALAVIAPPATAAPARTTVFSSTLWKLDAFAMDGSNVAVARHAALETFPPHQRPRVASCGEVDLARISGGPLVRLSARSRGTYCDTGGFGGTEGASFLALAGSRAYWVYVGNGNALYQTLFTGAPGSPQRTLLQSTGDRTLAPVGPFVGPLAASDTTFAYSQWRRVWLPLGCNPFAEQCTLSAPRDMTLTLNGGRVAVPSPGGVVASVDKGRAAVMLSDGRVAVVSRHATPVITQPIARVTGRVGDAALSGRWLAVLANGRIWVYDSATGRFRSGLGRPAQGATHVDVWNGIAVIATRRQVVAVRLANGHRQVIQQLGRGRRFVGGAQIESGGIVWATQPVHDAGHGLHAIYRVPIPHLH